MSRTSINKIETGKTILSFKTANDIANALGIVCIRFLIWKKKHISVIVIILIKNFMITLSKRRWNL
ncbi:MAG: helix-turn-helix transcriptional regulator [Finegoldia magna]|nr:helix-turn-helix transcriptional regulator [Finegoldia magna]